MPLGKHLAFHRDQGATLFLPTPNSQSVTARSEERRAKGPNGKSEDEPSNSLYKLEDVHLSARKNFF